MLQKIDLKTPDSLYIQVFLIYSIGSFADIKILKILSSQGQNGFYASYLTKDAKNEKTCYLHVFNLVNFQFDFVWPFESNRRNIVKLTAKDNKTFLSSESMTLTSNDQIRIRLK